MIEHVFMTAGIAVEELQFPSGETGRCIVIADRDGGGLFRYPMSEADAKTIGGQLMGIGKLAIPTNAEVSRTNGKAHK